MNVKGVKEPFYRRHRYFFSGYTFKFEGIKPDLVEGFVKIVQRLNGTITNDENARYIFVEEDYFWKEENRTRENLYDIRYIRQALKREDAKILDEFRFKPSVPGETSCFTAKVLQVDSCNRYYQENVKCKDCKSNYAPNTLQEAIKYRVEKLARQKQNPDLVSSKKSCPKAKSAYAVKSRDKKQSEMSSHESSDKTYQPMTQKKSYQNSTSECIAQTTSYDKRQREMSSNESSDEECQPRTQKNSHQETKSGYTLQTTSHNKRQRKKSSDESSDKECQPRTRKNSHQGQREKSSDVSIVESSLPRKKSKNTPSLSTMSNPLPSTSRRQSDSDIDVESVQSPKKWWEIMPVLPDQSKNYVEPTRKEGARYKGHRYSLKEKRIILSYIIMNDYVRKASSLEVYRQMHIDGYMRNRSLESLRNNFRRIILPKIDDYHLPPEIIEEFKIHN